MREKPNYGLDTIAVIKKWGVIGIASQAVAIALSIYLPSYWWVYVITIIIYCIGTFFLIRVITIAIGSFWLKFRERDWLFEQLALIGNEAVLDVG